MSDTSLLGVRREKNEIPVYKRWTLILPPVKGASL